MKTLNLKPVTITDVILNWGFAPPGYFATSDLVYMRCNKRGIINWPVSLLYTQEEVSEIKNQNKRTLNIMNAKEALSVSNSTKKNNYADIQSKITTAAAEGETYIWWYKNLTENDKELIAADGFTILQEGQDRDGYLAKISWKPIPPPPSSSPLKVG